MRFMSALKARTSRDDDEPLPMPIGDCQLPIDSRRLARVPVKLVMEGLTSIRYRSGTNSSSRVSSAA